MASTDEWNAKLIKLKLKYRLTNSEIANAMGVAVDRVHKWTCKNGNRMEQHCYDHIVLIIESGRLDLTI